MHTNYSQDSFFMKDIMKIKCSKVQMQNCLKMSFNNKKVKIKVINNVFNLGIIPIQKKSKHIIGSLSSI